MTVEIRPFVPAETAEAEFVGFHELALASIAADRPDAPLPTREAVIAELLEPVTGPGPTLFWTAHRDGRLVGLANVHVPEEAENSRITTVRITVDPASRRQGIGTALLREAMPELRRRGRTLVACHGVTEGGDGERWAYGLGFRRVHRRVLQRLVVADVEPRLWEVEAPSGYHLEQWLGAAPESLVDSFARARGAIHDAPFGTSSFSVPQWDAKLVREEEEDWAARGFEYFVVAACDDDGQVVGLTEMVRHPGQPEEGWQQYTAVLPEHRGHGLGRFAKAAMMRRLVAERPEMLSISTSTGAENTHMIEVNHRLGHSTVRTMVVVEAGMDALESRLRQDPAPR
ncbi:acetyltransferase (GNAT) family protein [Streptomyces sp. 846.5]|nr:acetyltransferase (GNAT) family protein [Streptomyces sp. 846.5]